MLARLVCVAAHPDDETIGAGALLARTADACILHVTDGAPRSPQFRTNAQLSREAYAHARRHELARALSSAGISPARASCLGAVDLEALNAVDRLAPVLADLLDVARPAAVVTHPYEGGHPDHDATALLVHAACALVRRAKGPVPSVFEMTSYHGAGGRFTAHAFLDPNDAADGTPPASARILSCEERALKRIMMDCFTSQAKILAPFATWIERLRPAPHYDFARAPHPGLLWYERLGMGTAEAWRVRAIDVLCALGLRASVGTRTE